MWVRSCPAISLQEEVKVTFTEALWGILCCNPRAKDIGWLGMKIQFKRIICAVKRPRVTRHCGGRLFLTSGEVCGSVTEVGPAQGLREAIVTAAVLFR